MKCPNCGNNKFYVCYEYNELNNNNVFMVEESYEDGWSTMLYSNNCPFLSLAESDNDTLKLTRELESADIDVCTKCGTALS